jgi:hypothetical protein
MTTKGRNRLDPVVIDFLLKDIEEDFADKAALTVCVITRPIVHAYCTS